MDSLYFIAPSFTFTMPEMRGVKLGESGSKVRVRSALAKPLPAARWSYIVSVWSPLVTMVVLPSTRTGA